MKKLFLLLILLITNSIYAADAGVKTATLDKNDWIPGTASLTSFDETRSYYLIIIYNCHELGSAKKEPCENIELLEVNKNNGEVRRFVGEEYPPGNYAFRGYLFYDVNDNLHGWLFPSSHYIIFDGKSHDSQRSETRVREDIIR